MENESGKNEKQCLLFLNSIKHVVIVIIIVIIISDFLLNLIFLNLVLLMFFWVLLAGRLPP